MPDEFDAIEAKAFFENRGYTIIDRRSMGIDDKIRQILPKKIIRENSLKLFKECIIKADEQGVNKWAIHIRQNKIRLLVGSIIACSIEKDRIWIALDGNSLDSDKGIKEKLNNSTSWEWDKEEYPEYSRVKSQNGYYKPNNQNLELWKDLKKLHFKFIQKAGEKFEKLNFKSQENHSTELLKYIQDFLDISLPEPEYNNSNEDLFNLIESGYSEIDNDKTTERDALIKSRLGQGKFRTILKSYWENRCAVTGCSKVEILKASHIKPWSDSSNTERLGKFNGLLLIPNLDSAFDAGYISFNNNGSILISKKLIEEQRVLLGINNKMCLRKIHNSHKNYLKYHREYVFLN